MAHRYFLDEVIGEQAFVRGDEAKHLVKVMRIEKESCVTLCSRDGYDYHCAACSVSEKEVIFDILSSQKNPAEASKKLTVYMALPKSDKLEFVVQKMCELGAANLVAFESDFCIAKLWKKGDNKRQRLQKIADEACKQSGRSIPLQVDEPITFKQLLTKLSSHQLNLFFYENTAGRLRDISFENIENMSIIIGSEGGFSEKEAAQILEHGAVHIGLGKRILRCETAAVTAASAVMLLAGELE